MLDGFARIVYRGAIDDQHIQGKSKDTPDHNYLRDALACAGLRRQDRGAGDHGRRLLDRPRRLPSRSIHRELPSCAAPHPQVVAALDAKEKEHPVEVGKVSYSGEVAAILQNKCQNCHRPGQVGPFSC